MGSSSFGFSTFRGKENGVNIRKDTSIGNSGISHKFIQFFVISDGEENVSGDNSGFFVIFGGVSGKFQDFSGQIFKNGSKINGGTSSNFYYWGYLHFCRGNTFTVWLRPCTLLVFLLLLETSCSCSTS